jgi:hypothetical protein
MKRRYRVRIIELAGGAGSAALARDFGVRAASGELACLLDPGDSLGPGFFAFLKQGPWREDTLYDPASVDHDPCGATGGDLHRVGVIDGPRALDPDQLVSAMRRGDFRGGSGVVFARSQFERAGGMDHRLSGGEMLDLWWWAARAGARAEDHHGRVHVSAERQDIGRLPGRVHRIERAVEPAPGQESIRCP